MKKVKETIISDLLAVIITILILVLLSFRESRDMKVVTTSVNRSYDIYLITIDKIDQHWTAINQGASDMARLLGVTYHWTAPDTKDTEKQIELLKDAVSAGADVIMIAVNDPIRISGPIEDAKASGVKIIYVDTPAYEEAIITLSTDNYSAGMEAGKEMIFELKELGIESGRVGIIGVNEVTDSTVKREAGFREAIRLDGRYTVVPTDYENGDPVASQEAAVLMMRNYPDLMGLFGTNEGSTEGVGMAIKAQKKRIIGVGFDKSDINISLLREGNLDAVIAQNPYTMGYLGVAEAFAALKGLDTGPSILNTGVRILRRS